MESGEPYWIDLSKFTGVDDEMRFKGIRYCYPFNRSIQKVVTERATDFVKTAC
jgi:hypothetical protein